MRRAKRGHKAGIRVSVELRSQALLVFMNIKDSGEKSYSFERSKENFHIVPVPVPQVGKELLDERLEHAGDVAAVNEAGNDRE